MKKRNMSQDPDGSKDLGLTCPFSQFIAARCSGLHGDASLKWDFYQ